MLTSSLKYTYLIDGIIWYKVMHSQYPITIDPMQYILWKKSNPLKEVLNVYSFNLLLHFFRLTKSNVAMAYSWQLPCRCTWCLDRAGVRERTEATDRVWLRGKDTWKLSTALKINQVQIYSTVMYISPP